MGKWNFYTTNEIKPKGWLKRQLEIQAKGLCGNLDKVWPDVRDSAWIGGDREGWERVPYWLDGFIPLAYLLEDADMISRAGKYIDAILRAQKEDGWICPCEDHEREQYDTWAVQLIAKVLVGYYECSGDERIPQVVYRILKNYYDLLKDGSVKLFAWGKFRWFETFIAVRFLYDIYKEDWLNDLAKILKDQGADYHDFVEDWKRPLNRWRFETHIVNIAMMLKYEAVSCDLLGEDYSDRAEYLRSVLDRYNGTVYESFTGDECLSGRSPIQGTELCAIVEQMYSYKLLYAYTGDAKWAERLEVLAFNALPATISDDMWTHQYVQMSNQIACEKFPGKSLFRTNSSDAHLFGLEPNYGCCTANFGQGWPKFMLSSFLYNGNTVINSLMLPGELRAGGKHILLETNYPFENSAKYTIDSADDFTFMIRIPSFARNVRVNGCAFEGDMIKIPIKGNIKQEIQVIFETEAGLKKGCGDLYAVQAGSLLFSVPIRYKKVMYEYEKNDVERKYPYCDYELLPETPWNYAYCDANDVKEDKGANIFLRVEKDVDAIPFSSEHPPVVIKTKVKQIDWGLEDGYEKVCAKVPQSMGVVCEEREIELYPYACAKLRMTELPII